MKSDEITSWGDFQSFIENYPPSQLIEQGTEDDPPQWVFRGIHRYKNLKSTLERACGRAGINLADAPGIEHQLVREFRRIYEGSDSEKVQNDTLYCMGLMQHYGAPTRLLDWTYSPYVALFFAIKDSEPCECGQHVGYLWVLNSSACRAAAHKAAPDKAVHIENRFSDEGLKQDASFRALYLYPPQQRFVLPENPWSFHQRHKVQQGVFLCPGDVSVPFCNNIEPLKKEVDGSERKDRVLRQVRVCMSGDERSRALDHLLRANVSESSLFPGLDGLAKSFWQRIPFFRGQHDRFKRQYKMTD